MKYQYFINMFETVVDAKVKDPTDRLIMLIEHTYGESTAYQRARCLLQENYRNPIKTANMYMEKLR